MINIAIVDDERFEHSIIRGYLDQIAQKDNVELFVADYMNGESFLIDYSAQYDIVLLDINMTGMNGIEVAKSIRKMDKNVIIIFITNMVQYVLEGYEVEALDFIVKPLDYYSFAMKMSRAFVRAKHTEGKFLIKIDRNYFSLNQSEIKYIEVTGHYIKYHTTTEVYEEYNTMKNVEKNLDSRMFVRCNRCYIVNLWYVSSVQGDMLTVGNEQLLISHPQRKTFLKAFADFIGGGK